jgi:hypothetical protein
MMAARLQSDIGRRAASGRSSRIDRQTLGVRLTGTSVPTFTDNLPLFLQHTANARIRIGGVEAALSKPNSASHQRQASGTLSIHLQGS